MERWLLLLAGSALLGAALTALHVSGALLIGPMAVAIVFAANEAPTSLPDIVFQAAQAIIGIMVAGSLKPSLLLEMQARWPLFGFAIASVLFVACAIGWVLTRRRVLPGTSALWGSFPGAAMTMVLMADDFGADMRLVAFMQYLRVALVALTASIVARVFDVGAAGVESPSLQETQSWAAISLTLIVAVVGWGAGRLLRLPAGPLLGAMGLGAILQATGWLRIEPPAPLLVMAYAVVGWSIGARFTGGIIAHVARALPRVAAAIFALIAGCALLAIVLVVVGGVDPLTAYLAMSPGGADTVAIIAASSRTVDLPFVMALQVGRFMIILMFGPSLARFIAVHACGEALERKGSA